MYYSTKEFLRELKKMLPEDYKRYPKESFLSAADHAAMLWETEQRCSPLTKELFLQYVACPRVNNEDLSFFHKELYDQLSPLVHEETSALDAAKIVNEWCAQHARYAPTDERTASPRTVYYSGFGRCGELSTFVVMALRSVGIAARQVYVPKWSHTDDNHAWVEILWYKDWHYLGACEPRPHLNSAWFTDIAPKAVLVRSKTFGKVKSPLHGELLYQEGTVSYFNQTARYCHETKERTISVYRGNRPVSGAVVQAQVLNEGAFHTIDQRTTDDFGRAFLRTGTGTVRFTVCVDGIWASADTTPDDDAVLLQLEPLTDQDTGWSAKSCFAPSPASSCSSLSEKDLQKLNVLRRKTAEGLAQWEKVLTDPSGDGDLPASCQDLLDAARGNRREISRFLQGDRREARERMLRALPEKDLRDTPCEVLQSHFNVLPPQGDLPEDIYWTYVASPRLRMEKLMPWRDPDWVGGNFYTLPQEVQKAAALRMLGIPSRLRPLDGLLERWENGAFRLEEPVPTATLVLTREQEVPTNLWSITQLKEDGTAVILNLKEYPWADNVLTVPLPAGRYQLVSAVRAPDGRQFFQERQMILSPDTTCQIDLVSVSLDSQALYGEAPYEDVRLPNTDGYVIGSGKAVGLYHTYHPTLVLWFRGLDEPAVHLLEELKEKKATLARQFDAVFGVLDQEDPDFKTLKKRIRSALPKANLTTVTSFDYQSDAAARQLNVAPGVFPLVILSDGYGHAYCGHAGYGVGILNTMLDCKTSKEAAREKAMDDKLFGTDPDPDEDEAEEEEDSGDFLLSLLDALQKADDAYGDDGPEDGDGEEAGGIFGALSDMFTDLLRGILGAPDEGEPAPLFPTVSDDPYDNLFYSGISQEEEEDTEEDEADLPPQVVDLQQYRKRHADSPKSKNNNAKKENKTDPDKP